MWGPPKAVYIHVPFCRHRCGYCNFTVVAGREDLQQSFLDALEAEFESPAGRREVETIFIGGGTPTELAVPHLQRLLELVRRWFSPSDNCEWSVEANPFGLTREKLELLSDAGVNRISLGVQSFDAGKLTVLERDHREADILAAYRRCREYIQSISLDLIFAVPGETIETWREDLERTVELQPEHLSIYGLTFEKGASFWGRLARGQLVEIDEDLQCRMYELAIDCLVQRGWEHYEVSNFARPGCRCRHNEIYWTGRQYFGFGPGAARYVAGQRETNHRSTLTYMRRLSAGQSPAAESESLDDEDRAREQLVFQMRMLEGVERRQFAAATGFTVEQLVAEPLRRFVALGLLVDDGQRIRLTRDGLLVSDSLWPDFL